MINVKELTDKELWLLLSGIEQLHDSMRHNEEEYKDGMVDLAGNIRENLDIEFDLRGRSHSLDYNS